MLFYLFICIFCVYFSLLSDALRCVLREKKEQKSIFLLFNEFKCKNTNTHTHMLANQNNCM